MDSDKKITPRKRKALKTKQALFESAIKLFKEKGFENVHVEEITAEAGTSKGSFYTYFKSKDKVVIEHYKKIDEHYVNVAKNLPIDLAVREKILIILKEGLMYASKLGPEFITIVLLNQLSQKEEIPFVINEKREISRIILELVKKGQEIYEFRTDVSAEELSAAILSFYRGIFLDWCLLNGNFDFVNTGVRYLSMFLDAVVTRHGRLN